MNKLIASLAFVAAGIFGLSTASAQEIGPGNNVTINVYNGCCNAKASASPTRQATRPTRLKEETVRRDQPVREAATNNTRITANDLRCLNSEAIATFKVRWPNDGHYGDECSVLVKGEDLASIASQATRGKTRFRIHLTNVHPESCSSREAIAPVEINGKYIDIFAWRKMCKTKR